MDFTHLLIQMVSGAIGGNAAGAMSRETSLGTLGNTIVGAIGGGVGGQILNTVLGARHGRGDNGPGHEHDRLGLPDRRRELAA